MSQYNNNVALSMKSVNSLANLFEAFLSNINYLYTSLYITGF